MEKKNEKTTSEFQIIFDKLEEVKSKHQDLFVINNENGSLASSIESIKKIVESYSAPVVHTTFTKA